MNRAIDGAEKFTPIIVRNVDNNTADSRGRVNSMEEINVLAKTPPLPPAESSGSASSEQSGQASLTPAEACNTSIPNSDMYRDAVARHRSKVVRELKAFEIRRREGLRLEIASTKLHWKAVCKLLDLAIVEDSLLLGFLTGKLQAVRGYASGIGALSSLGVMTDSKQSRRRSKSSSSASTVEKSIAATAECYNTISTSLAKVAPTAAKIIENATSAKERWLLLSPTAQPVIAAQVHTAAAYNAFGEIVERLTSQVATSLKANTDFVNELKGRGARALEVVEGAATKVEQAYSLVMNAVNSGSPSSARVSSTHMSIETAAEAVMQESVDNEWHYPCLWLLDAKYRGVVAASRWSWVESEALLKDLFARARNAERERRRAVHDILTQVLTNEKALWTALPAEFDDATKRLSMVQLGDNEISIEVHKSLNNLFEEAKKEDPALDTIIKGRTKNDVSKNSTASSGLVATATNGTGNSSSSIIAAANMNSASSPAHMKIMDSPLRSPFVIHAEVLERRKEGNVYGGTWMPVLAVVTCDRHLHLFDLPKVGI